MAALVLAACAGKGGGASHGQDSLTVVGSVRVAGSTPLERVLIEPDEAGAAALEVTGDLRAELKRLSGAHVEVRGELTSADRLDVTEYTILDISGRTPIVGVLDLEGETDTLVGANGDVTILRELPAALLDQNGAKVWVVMNADGVVIGYGVIRER